MTRRSFLASAAASAVPAALAQESYPIIDIHQHTPYTGRTADQLVVHQRAMGISKTVLLPAGRRYGLAAQAGRNETVWALRDRYPDEYVCFANELPNLQETRPTLEKWLKHGAIGIGEQKFPVDSDSNHIELIASIAREYDVPVLLHFEHETYNFHIERFHKILEKFPTVNFIGHAQTWWGNIDKNHDQTVMYPTGSVTAGGVTDRYLSDYENMYGDLSAGSGRNSLTRDEEQARAFIDRHQDKLLFGSDCNDADAGGPRCIGAATLDIVRRLAPNPAALKKIFHDNAKKIMRI